MPDRLDPEGCTCLPAYTEAWVPAVLGAEVSACNVHDVNVTIGASRTGMTPQA